MTNERFTVERADSGSCDAVLVDTEQRWKTEVICFGSQARVDAIEAQLAGSAAPSEGDGRREVPLMTGHAVWQAISAGQRVEWRHPEGHWTDVLPEEWEKHADSLASVVARIADPAASSPDPLPPGVHRAPTGELLCRGIDLPEGWAFYGPPETIGASDDESRPWWDWRDREADVRTGDVWYRVRPVPPVPEPEKVPWAEAIWNKRLIARTFEGREPFVAMFVDDATGTEFAATLEKIITDGDGYEPIDADGLVSVLPLGDPK